MAPTATFTATITDAAGNATVLSAVTNITGSDRSGLVAGRDWAIGADIAALAGVLPGIDRVDWNAPTSTVTIVNPGDFANLNMHGVLDFRGDWSSFPPVRNVYFDGPSNGIGAPLQNAIVLTEHASLKGLRFEDCTVRPAVQRSPGINAHRGHDTTWTRADWSEVQDGAQWLNKNAMNVGTNLRNRFEFGTVRRLVRWTASTKGIVHPSDVVSHNDGFQIFDGVGWSIQGAVIDSDWAKQLGHWNVVDPTREPYVTSPAGTLPDGGPFQPIADSGQGTEATGRYHRGNLSGIIFTPANGAWVTGSIMDNMILGGDIGINAAGDRGALDVQLGPVYRNIFDRRQGIPPRTANNDSTWTVVSDNNGWAGRWDVPTTGPNANYYISADGRTADLAHPIKPRIS